MWFAIVEKRDADGVDDKDNNENFDDWPENLDASVCLKIDLNPGTDFD